MNVQKMRKQLARNVPDAVWRDFKEYGPIQDSFQEWEAWFYRMMRIKHGDRFMNTSVYQTNEYGNFVGRFSRVRLVAILR